MCDVSSQYRYSIPGINLNIPVLSSNKGLKSNDSYSHIFPAFDPFWPRSLSPHVLIFDATDWPTTAATVSSYKQWLWCRKKNMYLLATFSTSVLKINATNWSTASGSVSVMVKSSPMFLALAVQRAKNAKKTKVDLMKFSIGLVLREGA